MLSIPHMIVVFIVVLVVFGPQKLPELARGLGKLMAEFRKASTDFKIAFEEEMREMERQALQAERKKAADAGAASAAAAESSANPTSALPSGTETAAGQASAETSASSDPVISPVTESVPRSVAAPPESENEAPQVSNPPASLDEHQHLA
jgi:sec-independent protein translocase protein TatB